MRNRKGRDVLDYREFLEKKIPVAQLNGFEVSPDELSPVLKPHQRDIVLWAVRGGQRAIFASFGLGKSICQLEITRLIHKRTGGKTLIVCPLGVRQEFTRDAKMIGVELKFIRRNSEMEDGQPYYITNYESIRDGRLDPNDFTVVSLDEASILRSYGSKTYQEFLTLFPNVPYKFVATATPAPNRYKELIHYSGFLGIMPTGTALTRFFQRDSTKANNLTLYPHKEKEFWLWMHSWAVFLQKPSELGYSDEGYEMPELKVFKHEVAATDDHPVDRDGQIHMFNEPVLDLKNAAREKRDSINDRIAEMKRIFEADPESHYIIWHDLESERKAIQKALPDAAVVYGSLDLETREQRVIDFSEGKYQYFASKPEISGSGCNFQHHCHKAIFLGVGYKFNDFIQSVHRIYRYLQNFPCEIHLIYTESEREVLRVLEQKWEEHNKMMERMSEIVKEYGLNDLGLDGLKQGMLADRRVEKGEFFEVAHNDCVLEAKLQKDDSIDEIITSIPFSNHYEYTPNYADFGHTDDNDHFWAQMDYLTPELFRILRPGRMACIHVKDRILFGNVTGAGAPTVSPFHAEAIFHYKKHGFDYMGMITVITDVVRENNQTYRLGWTEQCKDGTKMGVGSPEYVLLLRKPQTDRTKGYADVPVVKSKEEYSRARWQVDAHAFWRCSGDRLLTAEEWAGYGPDKLAKLFREQTREKIYDYKAHVAVGEALDKKGKLPSTFMAIAPGSHADDVWDDINRMQTLNTSQSQKGRELHVCLARDSLVLTRAGFKPIQDVDVGDLVLTHNGNWKPVIAKACTGINPVVQVKAQGVPNLLLTPDHKLWARAPSDKARSKDHLEKTAPDWVEAKDTKAGWVNLKLPSVEESALTSEEWQLVGRHLAGENLELHSSNALNDMFRKCGDTAANMQIPIEGLCLNNKLSEALLSGFASVRGYSHNNKTVYVMPSRSLALGLSIIIQRAKGIIPSVSVHRVDGRLNWSLSFYENPYYQHGAILEDGAWKRVRNVVESGQAETWSLQVEDDASYTAEGCIVKNCPLQTQLVDRLIERSSNKGELVYDPFAGIMTVPYRAILLGRRGGGSELNEGYFNDGLIYLKRAEDGLLAPTLFDAEELHNEELNKESA